MAIWLIEMLIDWVSEVGPIFLRFGTPEKCSFKKNKNLVLTKILSALIVAN